MKKEIIKLLAEIEKKHNVKILMAVESGSREWGFASEDSDYDVRCVHLSPIESYLGLNPPIEQIDLIQGDIDIVSWDLRKFFNLFLKTNPTVSEWLSSKEVYISKKFSGYDKETLKQFFREGFNPEKLKAHYLSLARENYEKYIKKGREVLLKKYIYILRALGCIKYIQKTSDMPPLNWKESSKYLEKEIQAHFQNLINLKHKSEKIKDLRIPELDKYIEGFFSQKLDKGQNKFQFEEINSIVINTIKNQV